MSFTAMIINIMVTAYLLGAAPSYFYLIWSVKGLLFFPSMYLKFKKPGWQLFFYDFCYIINLLCYVYCWIYPNSTHFFHMLFVVANGPLAWSEIAFDNSLVFHDWSKVFSVFIHINPAILSYSLRWHSHESFFPDFPGQMATASTTVRNYLLHLGRASMRGMIHSATAAKRCSPRAHILPFPYSEPTTTVSPKLDGVVVQCAYTE
mmetsp:Transcript_5326/g.9781  ORF Transcript_5326/g.9781 Transcript_5326/m.9781 type:complete len:205 (-) Transcript_5326:218-832(-)